MLREAAEPGGGERWHVPRLRVTHAFLPTVLGVYGLSTSPPWALYSEEGVVALSDLHPEASPSGSSDSECTPEGCD